MDEKNYKIIDKTNSVIYNKFESDLYGAASKFPNKIIRQIIIDLLNKHIFLIGIGTNEYNDFGKILIIKDEKLSNIVLNTSKINIDITTGGVSDPQDTMLFAYYLYLNVLVSTNQNAIEQDKKIISDCIKYMNFLFFKVLKLSGLLDKQQELVKGLNEIFFKRFILDLPTKAAITSLENDEVRGYFLKYYDILDRYKKFTDIFSAYTQTQIMPEKTPNILFMTLVQTVGVVGFSLLMQKLPGFLSSLIISQYGLKEFKGLLVDTKFQGSIEEKIQEFHQKQKFVV